MNAPLRSLSALASALVLGGCGARTGLEAPTGGGGGAGTAISPGCDAGVTYIYGVTTDSTLVSYYPPTGGLTAIGTIDCPVQTPGASPYSMAVDRAGTAYVVFDDGNLYQVSTADASCAATSFVVGQHGFVTFGLAFSADTTGPGETLFVAEEDSIGPSLGLATIDVTTLDLSFVGPFSAPLGPTELTGTGDGRLFGFSVDFPGPGSHVSQIDKTTADVLSSVPLPFGGFDDADTWAFWGGSFYIFDAPGTATATTITRFNPGDGSTEMVATYAAPIVGAGVSTCAPH